MAKKQSKAILKAKIIGVISGKGGSGKSATQVGIQFNTAVRHPDLKIGFMAFDTGNAVMSGLSNLSFSSSQELREMINSASKGFDIFIVDIGVTLYADLLALASDDQTLLPSIFDSIIVPVTPDGIGEGSLTLSDLEEVANYPMEKVKLLPNKVNSVKGRFANRDLINPFLPLIQTARDKGVQSSKVKYVNDMAMLSGSMKLELRLTDIADIDADYARNNCEAVYENQTATNDEVEEAANLYACVSQAQTFKVKSAGGHKDVKRLNATMDWLIS